ncbi:MAG: ABC transporter ATP-binding protein [Nonomuraea sp.]|nr:ABC transporter ATP-binding protein [Nonomuraea sp.]
MTAALQVDALSVSRGESPVVHQATLRAEPGAVTVLLGANGAGKTTLLDGIAGLARATEGRVAIGDVELSGLPTYRRARSGIGYAEQARTVFATLTLEQNLLVCGHDVGTVYKLFPELERRRALPAANLSGGEQQMLVLGRAFIAEPRIVLIDEMSLGLAPVVVRRLMKAVADLAAMGIGVLLVEQFANLALEIGAHAYVLRKGRVVYDGPCAELRDDADRLHEAYFGGGAS